MLVLLRLWCFFHHLLLKLNSLQMDRDEQQLYTIYLQAVQQGDTGRL